MTTRPARWVSWEYQLMYSCNRMKSDTYQSSVNHWSQHFSVSFRPSSRWRMGMSGEHYRNVMTEKHSKSFVLLDADLSYNLSSHCEINLRLSNLLNEKRYASTMLGDLTRSYSEYRIRPFHAVVEVYYRF
ncbi:MAG: TonB-dependent receptor [Bacteroidaceae bacterium]|nr:TonB-dependent receptor [Bacteroidaceae bacterium]